MCTGRMKRLVVPAFLLATGATLFACADERPLASDGTATGVPSTSGAGDAAKPVPSDSGAEDAGEDAAAADASTVDADDAPDATVPDGGAEAGPIAYDPDAICSPGLSIGPGTFLPISTAANDVGLSVTPDGLSAAWTTAENGIITVHYVDRASAAAPFGAERITTGAFGSRRVALRSDGLGLAVVNADRLGFSYLERADRAESFGAPSVGPFELLSAQGSEELAHIGEHFDNPVFARLDMFLFYTRVGTTTSQTFVSTRFSLTAPFAGGAPFAEDALGGSRIVTGASEDVRSLFVWDDLLQKSRMVTLSASSLVVGDVELGSMRDVQASADCKTFWFGRDGDLFSHSMP